MLNGYGSTNVEGKYKSYFTPTSGVGTVKDVADNVIDNMAANVQAVYSDDYIDATVAYRFRGAQAGMMYVEQGADCHNNVSDQLGDPNTMKAWLDFNYKMQYGNVGINPYMTTKFVKAEGEKASMEIGAKFFSCSTLTHIPRSQLNSVLL